MTIANSNDFTQNVKLSLVTIFFCIFFVILMCWSGWYTVEQGNRALVLRFGEVISTSDPGFHFKIPFVDDLVLLSVRTTKRSDTLAVYSKDIQGAEVALSINYSLNPAKVEDIYTKFGQQYENRVLIPQIMSKAKDVFGQYNAVEIVQSRERLTSKIVTELQNQFTDSGILIESVQIENIDFSDEYERSVEERMKAEVEVAKVRQNLEREKLNADMVRAKAQGEADAKIMEATAEAKAIAMRGVAEAEAIIAKATALMKNPVYVQLMQAERWNGVLPTTVLPTNAVPIIKAQ